MRKVYFLLFMLCNVLFGLSSSWAQQTGKLNLKSVADVSITAVLAPQNSSCGLPSDTIKVMLKHVSGDIATEIPVFASITKPDNSSSVINGNLDTLRVGDSAVVNLTSLNTTLPGIYHVKAWISLSGDSNPLNDTIMDYAFEVRGILPTPVIEDFEMPLPAWELMNMAVVPALTHGNSSAALSFPLDDTHPSASATLAQRVAPIGLHTHLLMNYRIVDAGTFQGVALQLGDSLFVEVSTDCQNSFTRIASINASNHVANTGYKRLTAPLSSFTGQNVIVRISGTRTAGAYVVDIDSLEIRDADLCNVAVVSKVTPVSKSCGVLHDPITAVFKNAGDAPVQNIPVSIQFFRPYNPPLVTFHDTIPSVLLPGETIAFTFDSTLNTSVPGKYTMLITSNLAGDTVMTLGHTGNNTFIDSAFTYNPLPVPYQESFTTTSYLNDYSTTFTHDLGQGVLYQNINTGFTSSTLDLIHKVGPVGSTHSLFFQYRFTDQSDNAIAMGNDDSLAVYVSTDCGATLIPLYTVKNSNHVTSNQWVTKQLSLSAFSGQSVLVSMVLKGTTDNSKFSIDNIVIDGIPIISISPDTLYKCSGQTAIVTPTGSALYQYEWVEKSAPSVVVATIQQLQVTTSGYYKVKATNGVGLTAYDSIYVFFRQSPVVSLVFGNSTSSVCPNSGPVALSGQSPIGAGGVFSGTGVTSNQFNPQAAGAGLHLITYTFNDSSNCSGSAIDTIVVTPVTVVSLSGIPDLCLNAQPYALTEGTPSNGVYSGAGVSGGTISPAIATVGSHIITYTYTDAHNCPFVAVDTLSIKPLPNAYAGNDVAICTGDSVTLNASGGGTYIWSTLGATSTIRVSPISSIPFTVTVTGANGCTDSDTVVVTVKPVPVVELASLDTVCLQQGLVLLSGGSATPAGGTGVYSGAGVSGNSFNPLVGLGAHTIRYTYTLNGCTSYAENTIIVGNCAGVNENNPSANLSLMPNPAENGAMVTADLKGNVATLAVFDVSGKRIQSQTAPIFGGKLAVFLDFNDLTSGIYFLRVSSVAGVAVMKFVKK